MTISTGKKLTEQSQVNKETSDDLLALNDTENISRIFTVKHKPIRLIAFGLFTGEIAVLRVLLPKNKTSIDCHGNIDGKSIQAEIPYTIDCQPVKLCPKQSEIVIDGTGTFRLQYVGDERANVRVISLTEETPKVPKHLTYTLCCDD